MQVGVTRQIRPRLRDQVPRREHIMLVDRDHHRGQGHLGPCLDHNDQLKAIHRDLDLLHLAMLVGHLPLASDLASALILCRRLHIGGVDDAGLGSAPLSQGTDNAIEQGIQLAYVQPLNVLGKRVRTDEARGAWPLPCGCTSLTHSLAHPLGLEADHGPDGLVTEQRGSKAFMPSTPNRVFTL